LTLIEDVRMDERFSYGVFSASQEGTLVYQTGKAQTRSTMTWMDRSGKPLGVLGEPTQYFNGGSVQISPDGKQTTLAVVNPDTGLSDIYLADLARGSRTRFTFGPADSFVA